MERGDPLRWNKIALYRSVNWQYRTLCGESDNMGSDVASLVCRYMQEISNSMLGWTSSALYKLLVLETCTEKLLYCAQCKYFTFNFIS